MDDIIVTADGLAKLKDELAKRVVRRREIADKIEYAKSLGDLSENFEYQEAKEDQALNESRVMELEDNIKRSVVSKNGSMGKGVIEIGSKIKVKIEDKIKEFQIVSFNEADPMKGKISNQSPLGTAFLGKKSGDKIAVEVPRGKMIYEITDVE